MSKTNRIKSDAIDYPVPQNREDAADLIRQIGEHQRDRSRIKADMVDRMALIKQEHEERAMPHADAISGMSAAVKVWAEANRSELTRDGKIKTVGLASGKILWRMNPPSVSIRKAEQVLDALKSLGLGKFIRNKEEINKDAILESPDEVRGVKGISIDQKEIFGIEPYETELEEVA